MAYKIKCGTSEGKEIVKFSSSYDQAIKTADALVKENNRTAIIYTESFGGYKIHTVIRPKGGISDK